MRVQGRRQSPPRLHLPPLLPYLRSQQQAACRLCHQRGRRPAQRAAMVVGRAARMVEACAPAVMEGERLPALAAADATIPSPSTLTANKIHTGPGAVPARHRQRSHQQQQRLWTRLVAAPLVGAPRQPRRPACFLHRSQLQPMPQADRQGLPVRLQGGAPGGQAPILAEVGVELQLARHRRRSPPLPTRHSSWLIRATMLSAAKNPKPYVELPHATIATRTGGLLRGQCRRPG